MVSNAEAGDGDRGVVEIQSPAVQGYLHHPSGQPSGALVLAHGAGSHCRAPLLVAVAGEMSRLGWWVLRCDLAFRRQRRSGPPRPSDGAADREGLRLAADFLRSQWQGPVCLGGHSYGGRQASMLAAENPAVARALLLLSYPLHPPNKPGQLRTAHWPQLRTPVCFVHGTRDPFGSVEELQEWTQQIPAPSKLLTIQGAGHDLKAGREVGFCGQFAAF